MPLTVLGSRCLASEAGTIVRRDSGGVLLRYASGASRHSQNWESCPSQDAARMALMLGEKELSVLQIIAEHLDVSDVGRSRIQESFLTIQKAFKAVRPVLGLRAVDPLEAR